MAHVFKTLPAVASDDRSDRGCYVGHTDLENEDCSLETIDASGYATGRSPPHPRVTHSSEEEPSMHPSLLPSNEQRSSFYALGGGPMRKPVSDNRNERLDARARGNSSHEQRSDSTSRLRVVPVPKQEPAKPRLQYRAQARKSTWLPPEYLTGRNRSR
ncbi:hypothetical protein L1987_57601 [Smallanthus sonchifolius]|uniref:Uncharacterized protein n=1 Tax=Smallanthus sonchifolius TaxID=185202 RepID=A0ACB9DD05_9ASTR|nr:hypothetical protein L1987_57601 [Smallanthus sonchifolius]